jgi:ATP-dependent DNA helicase PIF1
MRLQSPNASVETENLKKFLKWILAIGDESMGTYSDSDIDLEIPEDLLVENTGDSMVDIVNSTYPNFRLSDSTYFKDRAILVPTNEIVDKVNEYLLSLIPLDEKAYLSADNRCPTDNYFNTQDSIQLCNS